MLSYPRRSRENRSVGTRYLRLAAGLAALLTTGRALVAAGVLAVTLGAGLALALAGSARAGALLLGLGVGFAVALAAELAGGLTGATFEAGVLLATTGLAFSGTGVAWTGLTGAGLTAALTGTTRGTTLVTGALMAVVAGGGAGVTIRAGIVLIPWALAAALVAGVGWGLTTGSSTAGGSGSVGNATRMVATDTVRGGCVEPRPPREPLVG